MWKGEEDTVGLNDTEAIRESLMTVGSIFSFVPHRRMSQKHRM